MTSYSDILDAPTNSSFTLAVSYNARTARYEAHAVPYIMVFNLKTCMPFSLLVRIIKFFASFVVSHESSLYIF